MPEPRQAGFRIRKRFEKLFPDVSIPAARILILSSALLLIYWHYCSTGFSRNVLRKAFGIPRKLFFGFPDHAWKNLSTFLLLFIGGLILAKLIEGQSTKSVGLQLGDWKKGLKWTAIFTGGMIPVVIAASFFPTFYNYYPMARMAGDSFTALIAYELLTLAYFFAWEFFFRGYMLFSLHRHVGALAIFLQMVPFAMLHCTKPLPEALGSIFVGILLGWFALSTRSFLYCALTHWLVALSMDVAALWQKGFFE